MKRLESGNPEAVAQLQADLMQAIGDYAADLMTTGQLAKAAGCSRHRVRYLVQRGAIRPAVKTALGALYSDDAMRTLVSVNKLKQ